MFYAQSSTKGPIRAKQNVFLPQVNILIHCLIIYTHSTVEGWIFFGENEVEWAVEAKHTIYPKRHWHCDVRQTCLMSSCLEEMLAREGDYEYLPNATRNHHQNDSALRWAAKLCPSPPPPLFH